MRAALALLLLAPVAGAQTLERAAPHVGGASAAAAGACPEIGPEMVGEVQYYASGFGSGECFVSVTPVSITNLVYRDFDFFSDGMLMIFSSYGPGSDTSKFTSARVFYLFPRQGPLGVSADAAKTSVRVRLADGGGATIDAATALLSGLDRGRVSVSPRVDPAERGGVEIASYDGLLLDAGFRMGEMPTGLPNADSVFRNQAGQTCAVKNSELFDYSSSQHPFKRDDAALSAWLKTRCPGFSVPF